MKKIIALAFVGLFVTACDFDLREDEASAKTVRYAMVTGRSIDADAVPGPFLGTETGGVWTITDATVSRPQTPAPTVGSNGRLVVVTTDGLLDGASIEATPQTCTPAGGWLTVTGTGVTATQALFPTATLYTCYYPSSATTDDGASVFMFYSEIAPGATTASQPIRSGRMAPGDYSFRGTIQSKDGSDFPIAVDVTVVP
jgi:hypothetical protein